MSVKYTPAELAAAAACSTTTNQIVQLLGLQPTPGRNRYVMARLRELGIDCSHIDNTPRLYTREMLAEAAAASTSISEVVRRLGAKEVGGTQTYIGRQLRHHEIDISHFVRPSAGSSRAVGDVATVEFAAAVAQASSIAECARILDVVDSGAFRRNFHMLVTTLDLDTSHMLGQGHRRRKPSPNRTPAEELLVWSPDATKRIVAARIRRAMIEIGIRYACATCGTGPDWQGHRITLEVDHINGDYTDNRPENLRFLCPNCHAATPTFCRKKC